MISNIQSLRERLIEQRNEVQQLHEKGLPSPQVTAKLASVIDSVVHSLYEHSLESYSERSEAESLRSQVAIVGLGSYGRRQCSPHSDVDLMILHSTRSPEQVTALFRPMTQGIFDVGLQLGHSVRTPSEAVQLAREDPVICTSMIDTRLLMGSKELYDSFRDNFAKMMQRNKNTLIRTILEVRAKERDEYGATVYLLEPHVKRSRGGLRDLNLIRWLGFAEHGVSDPDRLQLIGALSKFDHRRLINTREFLLRLRNELHFYAQSHHDLLNRAQQLRIAEKFHYRGGEGMLPVERFMRDYFRHTSHLWQLIRRRDASLKVVSRVSKVLDPVLRRTVEGDYRIGWNFISATPAGLAKLKHDMSEVLSLIQLSLEKEKPIDHSTWSTMFLAAPDFSDVVPDDVRREFWQMLGNSQYVGEALRMLHELGYLEKIVPAVRHARCLLQFNQYHKFTVDEHCIRSVRQASQFALRDDVLGNAYRDITNKRVLHLALLLHDLGKGHEEDHSEVGKEIAEKTAQLLRLDEQATEDLVFLVHKHLMMSHLTFRRDTGDKRLLQRFAIEVGSVERLRMLFVLTCADLDAVGPGVLNDWKVEVLAGVYYRCAKFLEQEGDSWSETQLELRRIAIENKIEELGKVDPWYQLQVTALPDAYLARQSPEAIARTLIRLQELGDREADAWYEQHEETRTLVFTAGVDQGSGRGAFSSMAGVLSAAGMQILSADTDVLADGLLMLRFEVADSLYPQETPAERCDDLCQQLIQSVDSLEPPTFRKQWGSEQAEESIRLTRMSNQVNVDNKTSDHCTLIEVFTFDRAGLLYQLARKLHDLRLVIQHAKIGTHLDQVVDVFYVTNRQLEKLSQQEQLDEIHQQMLQIIEN